MGEQRVRIVAGEFKGRVISAPKGASTRPTADRVREGLFSALVSRLGVDLGGGSALDAFAGSGALGLEALSRGASTVTFVEQDRRAFAVLRENVAELGVEKRSTVLQANVSTVAERGPLPGAPFSLLFLDPPYRIEQSEVRTLIECLVDNHGLTDGAVVLWEHDATSAVSWPSTIGPLFHLKYGSTRIDAGTFAKGDAA